MKNITKLLLILAGMALSTPAFALIEITGIRHASGINASQGEIDLTVTGNAGPFTFQWSNGKTTEDIDGLSAGTYTVTVTNAFGCTKTLSAEVTLCGGLYPSFTVSGIVSPGTSPGLFNVDLQVEVQGNIPLKGPLYFKWVNKVSGEIVSASEDLTGIGQGLYCVIVSSTCAQTVEACFDLSACAYAGPNGSFNLDFEPAPAPCPKMLNGGINLSVSGAPGPYTYLWSNAATTEDLSAVAQGTYLVKVTDANGCTHSESYVLGPSITSFTLTAINTCNNTAAGSAEAALLPATGNYIFNWSNGITATGSSHKIENLTPGQYCVTVSNTAGNCQLNKCVTVLGTGLPSAAIIQEGLKNTDCSPETGYCTGLIDLRINPALAGVGPYTFDFSGPNGFVKRNTSGYLDRLCAGSYSVTVTASGGCTAGYNFEICCCPGKDTRTYHESPCYPGVSADATIDDFQIFGFDVTPPSFANNMQGSIIAMVSSVPPGVTVTYNWEKVGDPTFHDYDQTASLITAGTYCVTVSDGCRQISSCTRVFSFVEVLAQNTCEGGSSGKITLAFDGSRPKPYTIAWNNGGLATGINSNVHSISGLAAGNYQISITDAENFTFTAEASIVEEVSLSSYNWPFTPVGFDPLDPDDQCFKAFNNAEIEIKEDMNLNWYGSAPEYTLYIDWPDPEDEVTTIVLHPDGDIDVTNGPDEFDVDAAGNYNVTVRDIHGCRLAYCFQFHDEVSFPDVHPPTEVPLLGTPNQVVALNAFQCCDFCGNNLNCDHTIMDDCGGQNSFEYQPDDPLRPCNGGVVRSYCSPGNYVEVSIPYYIAGIEYIDWESGKATAQPGICRYDVACLFNVTPDHPFFDPFYNYPLYVKTQIDLPNSDCPKPVVTGDGTLFYAECPQGVTIMVTDDENCLGTIICNATGAILERDVLLSQYIEPTCYYQRSSDNQCFLRRICTLSAAQMNDIPIDCETAVDEGYPKCLIARPEDEIGDRSGEIAGREGSNGGLELFPVPAYDIVNLRFPSAFAGQGVIDITDMQGKVFYRVEAEMKTGINVAQIDFGKGLPAGIYRIGVTTPDKAYFVGRLVKL